MFKWRDKKGGIREEETEYEKEREKKKEWRNMWRYRQGVRYREIQFFINFVNDIILFIFILFFIEYRYQLFVQQKDARMLQWKCQDQQVEISYSLY